MRKVWTPDGFINGKLSSWVGKGESIINYNLGKATLVDRGTVGVDNQPSSVSEDDDNVIAGNDTDWSNGMKFSTQIAPLTAMLEGLNKAEKKREKNWHLSSLSKATKEVTDKQKDKLLLLMKQITDRQAAQHEIEGSYTGQNPGYMMADKGKDNNLPGFKSGKKSSSTSTSTSKVEVTSPNIPWWQRAMPNVFGAGAAAYMLDWWKRNPIQYHNTYARNPYENRALQIMAENRVSPYPALRAMQSAERRANYNLDLSGGLTGGQRYLGKIATAIGNARNAAEIFNETEAKNTALRNQYAEAAAKYGSDDAQRMLQANQHDWEDYIKAHGAKTKGIETHIRDLVSQYQNWYQNESKYKMWRASADMYQQQLDDEQKRFLMLYGDRSDPDWYRKYGPFKTVPTEDKNYTPVIADSKTGKIPVLTPADRLSVPSINDWLKSKRSPTSTATAPYVGGDRQPDAITTKSARGASSNAPAGNTTTNYYNTYYGSYPELAYGFGNAGDWATSYINWYGIPYMRKFAVQPHAEGRYAQIYPNIKTGFGRFPDLNKFDFSNGIPWRNVKFDGLGSKYDWIFENNPYLIATKGGINTNPRAEMNRGKDIKKRRRR